VFYCDETKQFGTHFGERFANAMQAIYNMGYEAVISIGNDTPQLEQRHLQTAIVKLNTDTPTIGPSYDGGFYLLGLHQKDFNYKAFVSISWNTAKVFDEFTEHLRNNSLNYHTLEKLHDIDHGYELQLLRQVHVANRTLKHIIALLTQQPLHFNTFIYFKSFHTVVDTILNKGSPSFLL
jgi:glycosyltransferase A (GT-A) superfamily protein (DUF2064 family)